MCALGESAPVDAEGANRGRETGKMQAPKTTASRQGNPLTERVARPRCCLHRWLGQSGDDPRRDAGYAVLNQRSPDPVSGSLLYCYLLFESNIRGIRLLVAGALAFEVKGQAFVA